MTTNVHTFSLRWNREFDPVVFDMWVHYAMKHSVKHLDIDVHVDHKNVGLFDCIFACQFLEELSLTNKRNLDIPSLRPPELGRLKRLTIKNFVFKGGSLRNLISGCPVLEIYSCRFVTFWVSISLLFH